MERGGDSLIAYGDLLQRLGHLGGIVVSRLPNWVITIRVLRWVLVAVCVLGFKAELTQMKVQVGCVRWLCNRCVLLFVYYLSNSSFTSLLS